MTQPVAIVTGASRGLGAAVARILTQLGARVILNGRAHADLQKVAGAIQEQGGEAIIVAGDVSRPDDCRQLIDATLEQFGRLDALVNNAGVLQPVAPLAEADPAAWEMNVTVNLIGPARLTHLAIPHLRQSQGRIVNVSSGAAVSPMSGWSAYCASKAALNHLTAVTAVEEPLITALAVRPGVVDTAMQAVIREEGAAGMPDDAHQRFMDYHANRQLLPPEAPGSAIAILALHAPADMSGAFLSWDDEPAQALVRRYGVGG